MRTLLFALPLLLSTALVHAHDHHDHDHEHDSPGKHEHGASELDVAIDGHTLELQLHSPAINLFGFEHRANNAADHARLREVHTQLKSPLALLGLSEEQCLVRQAKIQSPLLDAHAPANRGHSDVHTHYRLECPQLSQIKELNFTQFFSAFPQTERIAVQLIGRDGQRGAELSPALPTLTL